MNGVGAENREPIVAPESRGTGGGGGGACPVPGLPLTAGERMAQIEDAIAAAYRQFFLYLLFVSFSKDILVHILSYRGKMRKSLDEDFFSQKI